MLSLWASLVIVVSSGTDEDCLVGDIMYKDGDSIGVIGKECRYPDEGGSTMGDLAVHGTESFCENGKIVEVDNYVEHCFDKGLFCCQAGEPGTFGAAYCVKEENCVEYNEKDKGNGDEMELYAIAEFSQDKTGAKGEVSVDENGNVVIDLDLTEVDHDVCDFDDDKASYLYHIHNEWNYDELEGKTGTDCNADTIGLHMDPLETGVTCSDLAANDETIDYFSCELGDLSGRFGPAEPEEDGKVMIEGNISYSSRSGKNDGFCGSRLSPEVVYRKSIAFHCNDDAKTLLFCAPFRIVAYDEEKK